MIKRCNRCGKPLTEFEVSFHEKAGSPSEISSQCWVCSGAELQFMDGYTDKPHHRLEIFVCLATIAILLALFSPLIPYLNEYELPVALQAYTYVLVILYFALGTLATYIIRRNGGKKPVIGEWDPPMTRYQNHYGPNTDIYTTKINRDGDFVTTKETRLGGSIEDKWSAHASSGSSVLDRASNFYSKLIFAFLMPCLYLFAGGTFLFWVIPYLLIVLVRDRHAKARNKVVPKSLQRAYRYCRRAYGKAPISYDDKVGFLVSKENHKTQKAEQTGGFLSHYTAPKADDSVPFFYTGKSGVSYMIVEYIRPQNKNFGITFLLVGDGRKKLQKRTVVGNGFVPADPEGWQAEWQELGVSQLTLQRLDQYEEKMKKIMRGSKKNSEIVG